MNAHGRILRDIEPAVLEEAYRLSEAGEEDRERACRDAWRRGAERAAAHIEEYGEPDCRARGIFSDAVNVTTRETIEISRFLDENARRRGIVDGEQEARVEPGWMGRGEREQGPSEDEGVGLEVLERDGEA